MSGVAQKIVAAELMRWLQAEQNTICLSTASLEDRTRIKQWGKWALLGESEKLGIKAQLHFRPRTREEASAWGAVVPLSDDQAMRVDAAIALLGDTDRKVIRGLYMYWWSTRLAADKLSLPRCQLLDRRDKALAFIAGKVTYDCC